MAVVRVRGQQPVPPTAARCRPSRCPRRRPESCGWSRPERSPRWWSRSTARTCSRSNARPDLAAALFEEIDAAGLHTDGWVTTKMISNTILHTGTEEQKRAIVGGALRGEIIIVLGYTEPDSGSDVAAAKTRSAGSGPTPPSTATCRCQAGDAPLDAAVDEAFRRGVVGAIYGGSTEIMREIIAERVLGLPRSRSK